jgi:WD40 repeat protein
MIKRYSSAVGESSSPARKRPATSAPLDEDPLRPSSSQEHDDASSVPSMLPNLIAALILPFVQDRPTWNSVCCANKELMKVGKRMRPPWPNTTLNFGDGTSVLAVAFSPCKSFLACSVAAQTVVHVWDRHGQQTQLEGHTGQIGCLQYSLDGKYLASGSFDGSIRLWHVTSESAADSNSSGESRNRVSSRGTPQSQSDIILLGHRREITALAFPPTDSNLLASGCEAGKISLWDVINQVRILAFHPQLWRIQTICFYPGDNIQCYVVTRGGKMIRIEGNERMEFTPTILTEPSLGMSPVAAFAPCGNFFASIWYHTSSISDSIFDSIFDSILGAAVHGNSELAWFDLRTMAKTHSVFLSDHCKFARVAISPDGRKLATITRSGRTHLLECHDLTIQKCVANVEELRPGEAPGRWPIVFDPTNRVYAAGRLNGRVELRTL